MNKKDLRKSVVIGITGASGSILASKTIDALIHQGIPTTIIASNAARIVWKQEMDETFVERDEEYRINSYFTISPQF